MDYKEDGNSGPSEDEVVPPPTKKRKTAGGQKETSKRRKGKLSRLPDMPLDVLYEVASGKPQGTERH